MIEIDSIKELIQPYLDELSCFLVEIKVSKDNDILIYIESLANEVSLQDCEKINNVIIDHFDRNEQDYSLTVSSAGLDEPYKVDLQYKKAEGSDVIVLLKDGRKLKGKLVNHIEKEGILLKYEDKIKVEGKKKKETVVKEEKLSFDMINAVYPYLDIKI